MRRIRLVFGLPVALGAFVLSGSAGAEVTIEEASASLETVVRDFRFFGNIDADSATTNDLTAFEQELESSLGFPGQQIRARTRLETELVQSAGFARITASGTYEILHDFPELEDRQNMSSDTEAGLDVRFCTTTPMSFRFAGSGSITGSPELPRNSEGDTFSYVASLTSGGFSDGGSSFGSFQAGRGNFEPPVPPSDSDSAQGELPAGCYFVSAFLHGRLLSPILDFVAGTPTNPPETTGEFSVSLELGPPAPDGDTFRWVGPAEGSFEEASNWTPEGVPDAGSTIIVDAGTPVAIDLFGPAPAALAAAPLPPKSVSRCLFPGPRLFRVRGGLLTCTSPSFGDRSLTVQGGEVTLDGFGIAAKHAVIEGGGFIRAQNGGVFQTDEVLTIGGDLHGTLLLESGSTGLAREVRISGLVDRGRAQIDGDGTVWEVTGPLRIGDDGEGELLVTNGGFADNTLAPEAALSVRSQEPPPHAANLVIGDASGDPSRLHTNSLLVSGSGRVEVLDTGTLRVLGDASLGGSPKAEADLVEGSLIVDGNLVVGEGAGSGEIVLRADPADATSVPGDIQAARVEIGRSLGAGAVRVGGFAAAPIDVIHSDQLVVGESGFGELEVEGGSLLTFGFADVGAGSGQGSVRLRRTLGPGPIFWEIGSELRIGTSTDGSPTGRLDLAGAQVDVGGPASIGSVSLLGTGVLQGENSEVNCIAPPGSGGPAVFLHKGTILSIANLTIRCAYVATPEAQTIAVVSGPVIAPQALLAATPAGFLGRLAAKEPPPAPFGPLVIDGDAALDGTLVLQFTNGFAPAEGDAFALLQVTGGATGAFANVEVRGLTAGAEAFAQDLTGGAFALTSLTDAEALPTVSLEAKTKLSEKASRKGAKLSFGRSGDTTEELRVRYRVGGTARNGIDYAFLPGELVFPPGAKTVRRILRPFQDGAREVPETIELEVLPGDGYTPSLEARATIVLQSLEE